MLANGSDRVSVKMLPAAGTFYVRRMMDRAENFMAL